LDKWTLRLEQRQVLSESFELGPLQICADCGACDADCPVAQTETDFVPSAVMRSLLAGDLQSVLDGPDPWRCVDCMTCFERCHSRIGMAHVFERLRHLAQTRGHLPAAVKTNYETFLATGALGTGRDAVRDKLGLPSLPSSGIEDLKTVLTGSDDDG
jgi:heterodisulfide reductase subunit C